jgi:hypothetical protein
MYESCASNSRNIKQKSKKARILERSLLSNAEDKSLHLIERKKSDTSLNSVYESSFMHSSHKEEIHNFTFECNKENMPTSRIHSEGNSMRKFQFESY